MYSNLRLSAQTREKIRSAWVQLSTTGTPQTAIPDRSPETDASRARLRALVHQCRANGCMLVKSGSLDRIFRGGDAMAVKAVARSTMYKRRVQ